MTGAKEEPRDGQQEWYGKVGREEEAGRGRGGGAPRAFTGYSKSQESQIGLSAAQ